VKEESHTVRLRKYLATKGLCLYSQQLIDNHITSLGIFQNVNDDVLQELDLPTVVKRTIMILVNTLKQDTTLCSNTSSAKRGTYKKNTAKAAAAVEMQEVFDEWWQKYCEYIVKDPRVRVKCVYLRRQAPNSYEKYCERENKRAFTSKNKDFNDKSFVCIFLPYISDIHFLNYVFSYSCSTTSRRTF